MLLEGSHKKILLTLSREVLKAAFHGEADRVEERYAAEYGHIANLRARLPCFVTLTTEPSHRLRGCTGSTTTTTSLLHNVADFTQHTAFSDPRFMPLKEAEADGVHIGISVLGPLTEVGGVSEIRIGTHGLHVQLGPRRGLLLAKVAVEYGWNVPEFIKHTCLKANLDPNEWQTYQLSLFEEISFEESE